VPVYEPDKAMLARELADIKSAAKAAINFFIYFS
jgi:hypothetical protein